MLSAFAFPIVCAHSHPTSITVCGGSTCSQQPFGKSLHVALAALCSDTPSTTVHRSGCLGNCGAGPNVLVTPSPSPPPHLYKHIRSPREAAALVQSAGQEPANARALHALELKADADARLSRDDAPTAVRIYAEAVEQLEPWPALQAAALANWSAAWMEMGEGGNALEAANLAVEADPGGGGGWRRKAQAHEKRGERERAVAALEVLRRLEGGKEEVEKVDKWIRSLQKRRWWG